MFLSVKKYFLRLVLISLDILIKSSDRFTNYHQAMKYKNTKHLPYIILWLWFLLGIVRLRYFTYSNIPLWYDPGMYKEIFSHYRNVITSFDFSLLPQWIRHEPLLGIIAALANRLWISFDWMLTRGIGIINLIPWLLLFRRFKHKENNLRWGVLAAVLYRISIVQYQVFWSGYFKQTLGVSFMLMILILGEKKKLLLQSVLFFLLILLHKHTSLYTGAILAFSAMTERIATKRLPWKKMIYRTIAGWCALLLYIPLRSRIMTEAVKAIWESTWWDFMTIGMYIKYSRLVIILSLFGFWRRMKEIFGTKKNGIDVTVFWYILGILWIFFSLVNYNRTLVFLDIFVIIFAAYFLIQLFQLHSRIGIAAIGISLLGLSTQYLLYIQDHAFPLISHEEFDSIKNIGNITEPNALIMNTHRNYSPWIMGRSQRAYINPGMSDRDLWTHQQRNQWRAVDGNQKCTMLQSTYAKLNRPLYLRLWELQFKENLWWWNCFQLITGGNTWTLLKIMFNH